MKVAVTLKCTCHPSHSQYQRPLNHVLKESCSTMRCDTAAVVACKMQQPSKLFHVKARSSYKFFRHYLLLVLFSQMASGLFRLLHAALAREMVVADTFGSFAQIVLLILEGFLISRENIKKWWIWGYWSSPLVYAQNAIAVNEFLGHSWNKTAEIW